MKFENKFPSFENIKFTCAPCNKQLFSARNNFINVMPEQVVKDYLERHCIDKEKIKESILKHCIMGRDIETNTFSIMVKNPKKLLKELGVEL